jgi:DNA-binding transcriptional LysR family regulator
MNVQQLRYLVAVVDNGSVSAAARSLHVSQPVISRSLRAFELEHRTKLFERSGRRLIPTQAGTAVAASARLALAAIESVSDTARVERAQSELAIATTPTNGALLAPALAELSRCQPKLAVRVSRASDTDELHHIVETGSAELCFGDVLHLAEESTLTTEPVTEVEVVFVSPVGSHLPAAVSWDDVARERLVLPPLGSGRRHDIDGVVSSSANATPQASLVTEERTSWIAAAQAGIGSFLCYRPVADRMIGIEIRPFEPRLRVPVGFLRRSGPISSAAAQLLDLARSSLHGVGRLPSMS